MLRTALTRKKNQDQDPVALCVLLALSAPQECKSGALVAVDCPIDTRTRPAIQGPYVSFQTFKLFTLRLVGGLDKEQQDLAPTS